MKNTLEKIEEIKKNGYSLSFEEVFEHAIENYKKIAVYAGLMLLVFMFLFFIVILGILISFFDIESIIDNFKLMGTSPEAVSKDFMTGYLISIILITCLISPFQAGFLKMADCGENDEEFHVSNIFSYYKSPFLIRICLSALILTIMGTGITMFFENIGFQLLGTILSLLINFLTFMTIPLIIFEGLNAIESIKTSVIIVLKKPLVVLGILIVGSILSIVGLIALIIGVFFTIPFLYSINYSIYKAIIGFDSNSDLE